MVKRFLWIPFLALLLHGSFAASFDDYLDSLSASHWPDSGFVATWELGRGSPLPVFPQGTRFHLVSFSIRGVLHVVGPGLVPLKKIRSGETLGSQNVQVATVEWTHRTGTPLYHISDLDGKVAARTLVPTRPILHEHVRKRPIVLAGQEIYVEAAAGHVRARVRARALEEGACGDAIRVLSASSSLPMKVRIQDAQTAHTIE
jgi:flagella basal body P-ring formation protein FlgA